MVDLQGVSLAVDLMVVEVMVEGILGEEEMEVEGEAAVD